jgi:hypothetical protein
MYFSNKVEGKHKLDNHWITSEETRTARNKSNENVEYY